MMQYERRGTIRPLVLSAAALVCGFGLGCVDRPAERTARTPVEAAAEETAAGRPGGRLVTTLRAEPRTFNPIYALDVPSRAVIYRLMGDLVHINRHSQVAEPSLAEKWTVSDDGRVFTLELRENLRFSDGHPFGADDVLFTFQVLQDEDVAAPQRALWVIEGRPIEVSKLGPLTVELTLGAPYAVGDRLFDNVGILPRHLLEESYLAGELDQAWGVGTPPDGIAGMGPFRLKSHTPGQTVVLERNPYYWRTDAAGVQLPYLDEIVYQFVPSEDAQAVRLSSGEADVTARLSAENFAVLEREQAERGFKVYDLGPGLGHEFLFFNLNELPPGERPEVARRQQWFRVKEFRQAVSAAVDREGVSRLVFQGRATPIWSHVSPGNRRWFNDAVPRPGRSLERARELLSQGGFDWRDGELVDAEGERVAFSIITNSSNNKRVQMMTIVQQDLRELGMDVQVVALEFRAMLDRVLNSFEFDACIMGLSGSDADPNPSMGLLLSSSSSHLWHPNQNQPATAWETEIDELMGRQLIALDVAERKAIYDRVQELVADYVPIVPLVSQNILVAADEDLGNFRPAVMPHHTLWNADVLFWKSASPR